MTYKASEITYSHTFKTPKKGITVMWGEAVTIIGEQSVITGEGKTVEQFIYFIDCEPAENGKPYLAMKGNITVIEEPVELPELQPEKQDTRRFSVQSYAKYTRVSAKTGKLYSNWHFIGWSYLPDLKRFDYRIKGQYIITNEYGREHRYDMSAIVTR